MEVLQDLVDQDQSNHRIKSMAELLLSAMNDWPTDVQIDKFVVEFKKYFGVPLTLEKMKEKKSDLNCLLEVEKKYLEPDC